MPDTGASSTTTAVPALRWWPRARAGMFEFSSVRLLLRGFLLEAAILAVLGLPPIARLTGVDGPFLLAVLLIHGTSMAVALYLSRLAQRNLAFFHIQLVFTLFYNLALILAVVARSGDPKTPWWYAYILYACLCGALQELDAAWALILLFCLAPFVSVPLFIAQGAEPNAAWGSAAVAAGMGALVYYYIAFSVAGWRHSRAQQQRELDATLTRAAELERDVLARDLHDAVGSHLAVVALYGDLIDQQRNDPESLVELARTLRTAARDGLGELRAVLSALAPEATTVDGLAAHMRQLAERARGLGIDARATCAGTGQTRVPPLVRLAAVRMAQEATTNALRHGQPHHMDLHMEASAGWLDVIVVDDGVGFDPTAVQAGRGLAGLRRRAEALGGTLTVVSSPGRGANVRVRLPLGT